MRSDDKESFSCTRTTAFSSATPENFKTFFFLALLGAMSLVGSQGSSGRSRSYSSSSSYDSDESISSLLRSNSEQELISLNQAPVSNVPSENGQDTTSNPANPANPPAAVHQAFSFYYHLHKYYKTRPGILVGD